MKYKTAGDKVTIEDVLESCSTYITKQESIDLIKKAYDYIMIMHEGQKRKSGEPYVVHLIWVAYILTTLQSGPTTIAAGLLHDVMEDCDVSREKMIELFGEEITTLVEGVTKLKKMPYKDEADVYAENHRKIYIAMAKDIRVILIKFADRLHNMRTLQFMPPHKQQRISRETLEVYAPIAHRLGLNDIRTELEDLCLFYLDPSAYKEIGDLLARKREERKEFVDQMMESVKKILEEHQINFKIKGRAKHIYSIYKKMVIKHKRFDELYDLNALRIIVDKKLDCYEVLGIIHDYYRPLPGRFKDYIAMPKPNMYRSLHTAVIGAGGKIFEIQIRTQEMDDLAERGVASHWSYKEGKDYSSKQEQKDIVNKLQWLGDFISLSDEFKDEDAKDYYDTLRRDIFEANVYVMTPQSKIVEIPNGSTRIDFAYRIHTEVGHRAVGALVNGVMVPINTKLKTGDVVEIKTNKNSGPSEDWLKFVRSAGAKNKIRQYIAKKDQETLKEILELGRTLLKEEIRKRGWDEKKYLDPDTYKNYFGSFGANNFDDILLVLGKKQAAPSTLLDKVAPKSTGIMDSLSKMFKKSNTNNVVPKKKDNSLGISVSGVDGVKVQISKCCSPIPGDQIVGYVSKGQGIKVHRSDCPNMKMVERGRIIDVYWDYTSATVKRFDVDLEVHALDRPNLLNDIITVLGQVKVNISNINAKVVAGEAEIMLTINVENAESLQVTIDNLNKVHGIFDIKRVMH